ncbi:MAG: class I SAM-dependent methyltransferase [Jatrophihabitantaceae bacterium]
MSTATVRVSPQWLWLREAADAAARAPELVERVRQRLPAGRRAIVHDLGCGTGSMGRWLAPQLSGTQHWILHDRDAELLAHAAADPPGVAFDGAGVSIETRQCDITRLDPGELTDASLITASALLDILTADELDRFVTTCAAAGCPVLVTASVIGRVELTPAEPLDEHIASAFNTHQRRTSGGRRLLGPDAVGAAVAAFTRHGADVLVRPGPWRLDAADADLVGEWFTGWVGAACAQRPELTVPAAPYARRRMAESGAGRLRVTVHHQDLLALPR